jgi:hypothetical protein
MYMLLENRIDYTSSRKPYIVAAGIPSLILTDPVLDESWLSFCKTDRRFSLCPTCHST